MQISLNYRQQRLRGPNGLVLALDADQIFPNDPGQGTPAILILGRNSGVSASGTFNCAIGEGEVEGVQLDSDQMRWVLELENEVDGWLEHWTEEAKKV